MKTSSPFDWIRELAASVTAYFAVLAATARHPLQEPLRTASDCRAAKGQEFALFISLALWHWFLIEKRFGIGGAFFIELRRAVAAASFEGARLLQFVALSSTLHVIFTVAAIKIALAWFDRRDSGKAVGYRHLAYVNSVTITAFLAITAMFGGGRDALFELLHWRTAQRWEPWLFNASFILVMLLLVWLAFQVSLLFPDKSIFSSAPLIATSLLIIAMIGGSVGAAKAAAWVFGPAKPGIYAVDYNCHGTLGEFQIVIRANVKNSDVHSRTLDLVMAGQILVDGEWTPIGDARATQVEPSPTMGGDGVTMAAGSIMEIRWERKLDGCDSYFKCARKITRMEGCRLVNTVPSSAYDGGGSRTTHDNFDLTDHFGRPP